MLFHLEQRQFREKCNRGRSKAGCSIPKQILPIRTAPAADYNNEINHTGLLNGDKVQVTGATVQGTTFGGGKATYTWVYAPKYGVSGYVNAAYIK